MKKILVMAFAVMLLVLVGASAQASLWVPTPSGDLDVNYVLPVPVSTAGTFAIFDDNYTLDGSASAGNYLPLIPTLVTGLAVGFETIYFSQNVNGSDWDLSYSEGGAVAFTLTGDNTFQLGWLPSGVTTATDYWYLDTAYDGDDGVYYVSWANVSGSGADFSSDIIQIDAVPSAVPIPPSAIMLFSGILGLVGVRRMRRDS